MKNAIYNATESASQLLDKQAIIANNLANISTNGFKEKFIYFIKQSINHSDNNQHIFQQYYNLSPGLLNYTNRDLDIYIKDHGWLAVKDEYGKEAYTQNGHLQINSKRELTAHNCQVIGVNKNIKIPNGINIKILSNGNIIPIQKQSNNVNKTPIGQIKLVSIPPKNLIQKDNGLFYINKSNCSQKKISHDNNIKLVSGILEESNVSATKNMIDMISNAREFEMQIKMISICDKNEEYANQLLDMNN